MADGDGLENHCGGNVTVGSNPTPSALFRKTHPDLGLRLSRLPVKGSCLRLVTCSVSHLRDRDCAVQPKRDCCVTQVMRPVLKWANARGGDAVGVLWCARRQGGPRLGRAAAASVRRSCHSYHRCRPPARPARREPRRAASQPLAADRGRVRQLGGASRADRAARGYTAHARAIPVSDRRPAAARGRYHRSRCSRVGREWSCSVAGPTCYVCAWTARSRRGLPRSWRKVSTRSAHGKVSGKWTAPGRPTPGCFSTSVRTTPGCIT